MSEYIHSGIAGKINRIVKPHIGNILVTSDFGNAKESTLTEDVLKAAVNDINRIKYAVTYKGEKATVDALPTTGNTKGDMWNVTENGHNYAWTGSEWDDLGGTSNSSTTGNGNEAYVQVYRPQITSATPAGMIITNEDLGGVYQDMIIYLYTPTVPSISFGGDPAYGMQLQFLKTTTFSSLQDIAMTLGYSSITNDLNTPHMFVFRFLNDGGLLFGTQGQALASSQSLPSTECVGFWPFMIENEGEGGPLGIRFVHSLPTNSQLAIYARNKLNTNDNNDIH